MWDEKLVYLRIEAGYAYTKDRIDELLEIFNSGNFNRGSAILKIRYLNLKTLIIKHLSVKEKVIKVKLIV